MFGPEELGAFGDTTTGHLQHRSEEEVSSLAVARKGLVAYPPASTPSSPWNAILRLFLISSWPDPTTSLTARRLSSTKHSRRTFSKRYWLTALRCMMLLKKACRALISIWRRASCSKIRILAHRDRNIGYWQNEKLPRRFSQASKSATKSQ